MSASVPECLPHPDRRPLIESTALRRRLIATVIALGCGAMLGFAAFLTPADAGLGTHTSMGLPECGWVTMMDTPCMTCGMTTSFAAAADGNMLGSFQAQPLGFLLAVAVAATLLVSIYIAATGSMVGVMLGRLWRPRLIWFICSVALLAWVYKVLTYRGML